MKIPAKIWLMSLFIAVTGCNGPNEGTNSWEENKQEVIGGSLFDGLPAVGALKLFGKNHCTGTLITPQVVLTAGHCVDDYAPADMQFHLGPDSYNPQQKISVMGAIAHPNYHFVKNHAPQNDIGLVFLANEVAVEPMRLNEYMDETWTGHSLMFVGYGVTDGETRTGSGYKRIVEMSIAKVEAETFLAKEADKSLCFGDSGGPSFLRQTDGTYQLVGVASFVTGTCTEYSGEVRVDFYKDFIQEKLTTFNCHGETSEGRCDDNTRIWCEGNKIHKQDCSVEKKQCAFDKTVGFHNCISQISDDPCQGVEAEGKCEGTILTKCENKKLVVKDCALSTRLCGKDKLSNDTYACIQPDSLTEFCRGTNHGGCEGADLLVCDGEQMLRVYCSAQGKRCGYNKITKNYDCLLTPPSAPF